MKRGRSLRTLDALALGLLLLTGAVFLLGLQHQENPTGDSVRFLGLADNLRETGRYEFNTRPHTRFPPGFPALLAVERASLGDGYSATLVCNALHTVLALGLGYWLLRSAGHPVLGLLFIAFSATSPYVFNHTTRAVGSDSAYMIASFAALLLAMRMLRSSPGKLRYGGALALALCVPLAISVRSVGLALWGALAVALIVPPWRRAGQTFRFAPALLSGAGFQIAWTLWQRRHRSALWPGEFMNSYGSQIRLIDPHDPELGIAGVGDWCVRIFDGLAAQARAFAELVTHLPWIDDRWFSPLIVVPCVLGAVGLWHRSQRGIPLLEVYFLGYLGIILVWPFDEGARYMLAVFPIALLCASEGFLALARFAARAPERGLRIVGAVSAALLLAALLDIGLRDTPLGRQAAAAISVWAVGALGLFLPVSIFRGIDLTAFARRTAPVALAASLLLGSAGVLRLAQENREGGPIQHPEIIAAAEWLNEHSAPGEVLMAGREGVLHALSGRRAIPFPVTSDPELLHDVIGAHGIRYAVILEHEPFPYFRPDEITRWKGFASAYPEAARTVHRGPGYRVVEFRPREMRERRQSSESRK
jgi:hypothetical protein